MGRLRFESVEGMDLIVGAGITGLSYASYTGNDYLVIEKESEPGGYCRTIKQDGFVWDYSGHFFHFQDEKIKEEIISGIPDNHILTVLNHTQIRYKDRMVDYPFQKNIHQLSQDEYEDCLHDLFNNTYSERRSFKDMLYRKFGKSIAEKFLIPYNEKLFACDLDALTADAMGRFFPHVDKEEIGANNSKELPYNSSFLYTTGGAIEYIDSVCGRIDKDKIVYNEYLLAVDLEHRIATTNRREIRYDHLISTIPFPQLLSICGIDFDKLLYSSNKVLVFNIGFDKKGHDTKNNWVYYPEAKYLFYRVGCYDNIVPSDRLSVYVEIGYREDDSIDVEKDYRQVLNDLRVAGIISDHKVVSSCSVIMNPAYVHITQEMESDRERKRQLLKEYDVYSIGRYGSWTYCSIEDNIKEAKSLASAIDHGKAFVDCCSGI